VQSPLQHVECFHLLLLRLLEARVDRAAWVVKGGVNLRAWFGSRRYSEDLDVDVVHGTTHSLRERVDRLLASTALRDMLASQGLGLARSSRPKQTETTQRWKFEIEASGLAVPLHTRVEFSRRGVGGEYALEPARADIARPYGITVPTANHYTASAAIRQKIEALVSRRETQARDVWDLEHLLRTTDARLGSLTPAFARKVQEALDRVLGLPFEVYRAQVVPFLAPDDQTLFGTPEAWSRIGELIVERLADITP
jgi:predicted nucleotidyltransferase component of viral defense system